MTIQQLLYAFVAAFLALFPVMNPIGNGFIVNNFLNDFDDAERKSAVKKIILNCLLIGLGTLAVGHLIMLLFGLAVPVIQVGGGIVICKTGLEWLSESTPATTEVTYDAVRKLRAEDTAKKLFYPISFPICLGPGSMSVIFALMATASEKGNILHTVVNYAIIALAIAALLVILYVFLSQGKRITKGLGKSGSIILNKLIAFITFCIGIQILVTGIAKIFHLTIL